MRFRNAIVRGTGGVERAPPGARRGASKPAREPDLPPTPGGARRELGSGGARRHLRRRRIHCRGRAARCARPDDPPRDLATAGSPRRGICSIARSPRRAREPTRPLVAPSGCVTRRSATGCAGRLGRSLRVGLECPTQNRSKTPTETRGRGPATFVSPAPRPARQLAPDSAGFCARDANSFGSWKRLGLNGLKMRQVGLPAAPGVLLKTRGILALRARIPAKHETIYRTVISEHNVRNERPPGK